jgi:hypothetical protein
VRGHDEFTKPLLSGSFQAQRAVGVFEDDEKLLRNFNQPGDLEDV